MTNILVNIVIIIVVTIIIGSLYSKVDMARRRVQNNENIDPLTDGIFSIEYGKGIKILAIINLLFFTTLLVLCCGDYFGNWGIGENSSLGVVVFFFLYNLFSLYFLLGTCIWKVTVNKYDITYRNYLGITKVYDFRTIEVRRNKKGTIYVYSNGNKKIRIDDNLEGGIYFLYWAKKYKVYHT